MNRLAFHRSIPAVLVTASAAVQMHATGVAHASALGAVRASTFKGPTEATRHGPIQVTIMAAHRKIVKVAAAIAPLDDGRSPFLQGRAIPILKQETLTAQNANINTVSGATETSEAYIQSLQSAIKKARKARALA